MNHVEVMDEKTKTIKKIPIEGSETPEIHALGVWETIIPKAENCKHIALLGLGNGASLCKDIYLRQMVRSKEDNSNKRDTYQRRESSKKGDHKKFKVNICDNNNEKIAKKLI